MALGRRLSEANRPLHFGVLQRDKEVEVNGAIPPRLAHSCVRVLEIPFTRLIPMRSGFSNFGMAGTRIFNASTLGLSPNLRRSLCLSLLHTAGMPELREKPSSTDRGRMIRLLATHQSPSMPCSENVMTAVAEDKQLTDLECWTERCHPKTR